MLYYIQYCINCIVSSSSLQQYEDKLEELETAMVQRSAREEDSLVSQRKEYEEMLTQQRRLYEEKMTQLDKLHSQRKVSGRKTSYDQQLGLLVAVHQYGV